MFGNRKFYILKQSYFDSNTVPLESVIFVLNSALKEDLMMSEQLWHDQLSKTNSYICERYLYPNGNIVLSYFLKSSEKVMSGWSYILFLTIKIFSRR